MKIALFSDVYKICGVSRAIYQLSQYCRKEGIELTDFIVYPGRGTKKIASLKSGGSVKVVKLKPEQSMEVYPDLFLDFTGKNRRRIVSEFEAQQFDLILLFTFGPMGFRAMRLAKKYNLPLVFIHTTRLPEALAMATNERWGEKRLASWIEEMGWGYLKMFFQRADLILARTPNGIAEIKKLTDKPVEVFSPGVSLADFNPKYREAHEGVRVVYQGRLSDEKNLLFLSRLWRQKVAFKFPQAKLVLIGDGPLRKKLESELPEAKFTGFITGKKLAQYMASGDIFVYPSLSETFGQSIVQAMASGLPVVAFEDQGPKLTVSSETGFLAKNEGEFEKYLFKLLKNEQLRRQMGAAGPGQAAKFSWDRVNGGLMETLTRFLADR